MCILTFIVPGQDEISLQLHPLEALLDPLIAWLAWFEVWRFQIHMHHCKIVM